ncbi:hypothetical protein BOX15_Mlig027372g1 [Macrostomum lignano]|uniref:Integrase catalytic domain-containing protein n=1 Tax=Macrostomum lignano TaxID=282301 RepID=A0A267G9S9_9PLAT|nr:hypothetical protein BOX15_Mlig027372g1 [Macrostomum lignano]
MTPQPARVAIVWRELQTPNHAATAEAAPTNLTNRRSTLNLTDHIPRPVTREELQTHQRADSAIAMMINLLESQQPKLPLNQRLNMTRDERNLLAFYEQLEVRDDGLLVIHFDDIGEEETARIVLPKSLDATVFANLHGSPYCGHMGRDLTIAKVRERFWRPALAKAVSDYVASCQTCTQSKGQRRILLHVQSFPVCEIYGRCAIDILGPTGDPTDRGNKYILTYVDTTSKYPFAFAMKNQRAKTIITLLQEQVFPITGIPAWIHSNQWKQFTGHKFRHFCEVYGIRQTTTPPYSPWANGQAESCKKNIKKVLTCLLEDHQQWDKMFPAALTALRSAVNRTTGFSPHYVIYRVPYRYPIDNTLDRLDVSADLPEYIAKHQRRLAETERIVRQRLRTEIQRREEYYENWPKPVELQLGDLVCLANPKLELGELPKFHRPYKSMYKVIRKVGEAAPWLLSVSSPASSRRLPDGQHVVLLKLVGDLCESS